MCTILKLGGIALSDEENRSVRLINLLFEGSNFTGFMFGCHFILMFSRSSERFFEGKRVPKEFKLTIMSDWRFGSNKEWETYKKKFDTNNFVEEDEPVQAFLLTALRWSENSMVVGVDFCNDEICIKFKGEKEMYVNNNEEVDYSWIIEEIKYNSQVVDWSIICENNKIFLPDA